MGGGAKRGVRATALAVVALTLVALVSAPAAGAPSPANQARLEKTVRFLQDAQNLDGGFGGSSGARSGQLFTAWVALALAAAGINPRDQARPGGRDAFSYLVDNYRAGIRESDCAPRACTTTFERELMVVNAAGAAPRDFGGVDLVAELLSRARPDGGFPHVPGGLPGVNDTIFAIFALAPLDDDAARAHIGPAANWVESAQQEIGGWAWQAGNAPHEVDMTGAAIQALVAAGRRDGDSVRRGLEYLRLAQNPDGGFPEFPGETTSNAASTCWATQAIWAAGENPEEWRTDSGLASEEPLDYLESLQGTDGHIRWKANDDKNGIWMTAYCAPAFAGQAWPIPVAPTSIKPTEQPQPGQGGGNGSGDGVMAGGGGGGAALFSRPKPQSRGRTPGGARKLGEDDAKARNHSRTRRGENTEQPNRIVFGEPTGRASAPAPGPRARRRKPRDAAGGGGPRMLGTPLATTSGAVAASGSGGETVTGTVVGGGGLEFGAPGLHAAGTASPSAAAAIGIGGAAVLLALGGLGWERRRTGVAP